MDTIRFEAVFALAALDTFSCEADVLLRLVSALLMETRDDQHASKAYLTLTD